MASSRVHGRGLRSPALPSLHWFSQVSLRLLCLHPTHKVWHRSFDSIFDDTLLTGSDSTGLLETKEYLKCHFATKDMKKPKYFLRIEDAHKKYSIFFLNESML